MTGDDHHQRTAPLGPRSAAASDERRRLRAEDLDRERAALADAAERLLTAAREQTDRIIREFERRDRLIGEHMSRVFHLNGDEVADTCTDTTRRHR